MSSLSINKLRTMVLTVAALFVSATALTLALPVIIEVRPDHDNFTRPSEPSMVQDHTNNVAVGSDTAWLRFDVSAIPPFTTTTNATLTMRTRNDRNPDWTVSVFRVHDDAWLETTITPCNAPPVGPLIGMYDAEGTNTLGVPAGTSQLDTNDVTGWVQSNLSNNDTMISFALLGTTPATSLFFRPDEHPDQSEHPWALLSVTIEVIPTDSTNAVMADTLGSSFDSESNVIYHLQSTPDLVSTTFTDTGAMIIGNGETLILFDPTGPTASKKYRVVGGF